MKFTRLFEASITPFEEVSALQLAAFKRHKRNGTSPGNPKWYRSTIVRPFKAQLSTLVPKIETGADWHTANSTSRPCPFQAACGHGTTEGYVQAYEQAQGLKAQVDFAALALADRIVAKRRQRRAA